jgi:transcriptional regulator with XRE-family HTH domain
MSKMAKAIRDHRLAQKLSQAELAKQVDVTPAAVGNWEAGTSRPGRTHIVPLANALKVSPTYLLELE